ncbi:MAG TPA: hypothetical protein VNT56_10805 [Acidimicrobiales bacterium]|jgi:hypothetical protein|nr:hypothetical protein [Acidimicrobiales bacterium]
MDPKLSFLFYLAAFICFVLAALAPGALAGRAGRSVSLLPLGLALWLFPTLWTTGTGAF